MRALKFMTGHVIYNPAYNYKFQLKTTLGMQVLPHTQTAVNNFLGLHRFDAVFQILVGSWVSPEHHEFYANGNVLVSFLKLTDKKTDKKL